MLRRAMRGGRWVAKAIRDARTAATEEGVRFAPMIRDLLLLNVRHQMGVRAFFQYRLFDPRLSAKQKSEYLPDSYWITERLWSLLNPPQYRLPYENKLVFKRFFGSLGLPVAQLYGVYDPVLGQTADGRSLRNASELRDWLRQSQIESLVLKPVMGAEGFQVLVLVGRAADSPDSFVTLSGDQYDAERIAEFTGNTASLEKLGVADRETYLLEERIRPHPELVALVGPTLCCVRVVTVVDLDGEASILGAVYKLQPKPVGVDHLSHGAVGSWVDLDSGTLSPGRSRYDFRYHNVIPGTDRSFVEFKLPCWHDIKSVALRAAAAFPWARSIGWDIAISDRGPVLIEGNARWSTSLVQIPAPHGLMTGEFKALCDALAQRRTGRD